MPAWFWLGGAVVWAYVSGVCAWIIGRALGNIDKAVEQAMIWSGRVAGFFLGIYIVAWALGASDLLDLSVEAAITFLLEVMG